MLIISIYNPLGAVDQSLKIENAADTDRKLQALMIHTTHMTVSLLHCSLVYCRVIFFYYSLI